MTVLHVPVEEVCIPSVVHVPQSEKIGSRYLNQTVLLQCVKFILAGGQSVIRAEVDVSDQDHDGLYAGEVDQLGPVILPITVLC